MTSSVYSMNITPVFGKTGTFSDEFSTKIPCRSASHQHVFGDGFTPASPSTFEDIGKSSASFAKPSEPTSFLSNMEKFFQNEIKKQVDFAVSTAVAEKNRELEQLRDGITSETWEVMRMESEVTDLQEEVNDCHQIIAAKDNEIKKLKKKLEDEYKQRLETEVLATKMEERANKFGKHIWKMSDEHNRMMMKARQHSPTCGDNGGVTSDGRRCQRTCFLDSNGRCKDH